MGGMNDSNESPNEESPNKGSNKALTVTAHGNVFSNLNQVKPNPNTGLTQLGAANIDIGGT